MDKIIGQVIAVCLVVIALFFVFLLYFHQTWWISGFLALIIGELLFLGLYLVLFISDYWRR